MSNKEKEKLASEATSDEEQAKWEKKVSLSLQLLNLKLAPLQMLL